MKRRLAEIIGALSLVLCPAVSRADAILYTSNRDYSGLTINPPGYPGYVLPSGSTVSWSFEVPALLTSSTDVTALLSSTIGPGWGSCGTVTDVLFSPNTPGGGGESGYPATAAASWSTPCGPGNQLGGASEAFAQTPTSLGYYNVYGGSGIGLGFLSVAAQLTLQGGPGFSPTVLNVPLVAGVTGTIGGQGTQDYYLFNWGGGAFSATGSVSGTLNPGASYLFSEGVAGSCGGGSTATLNSGDSFTSTIAIASLAPGTYCIGIDANNSNDPAFAIAFNTPVQAATPEPSGVLLIAAGLGLMSVLRFKRHSTRG